MGTTVPLSRDSGAAGGLDDHVGGGLARLGRLIIGDKNYYGRDFENEHALAGLLLY